jgi:hypothetical protein
MDQNMLITLGVFAAVFVLFVVIVRLKLFSHKPAPLEQVLALALKNNAKAVLFEAGQPAKLHLEGEYRSVNMPPVPPEYIEEIRKALLASPAIAVGRHSQAIPRRNEPTLLEFELKLGQSAVRRA